MFNIEEATITDIQKAVESKEISYRELAAMYLERIALFDSCENGLNSVLEINPDVLTIAKQMDDDISSGKVTSPHPLYGIPVLLKDNIDTADKMHTSAGSLALADNFASSDAVIAQSIRKTGALFLGKANMTEFANFMAFDMPCGYSSRGGQVIHPYVRGCDPSGSSTGSAVAVAANLCAVSVGTETCGSIISPSWECGIVGIKPTAGLLSGAGVIPISNTLDTAGPMTRSVTDAAILLDAMELDAMGCGHLESGSTSYRINGNVNKYTVDLKSASIKDMRIGIYGNADEGDEYYNTEVERVLSDLEKAGTVIIRNINSTTFDDPWHDFGDAISVNEFMHSLNYYLSNANSKMKTLGDIVAFNNNHGRQCLKYGQQMLTTCLEKGGRLIKAEYINAILRRDAAIKELSRIFDENKFDVMIPLKPTSIAPTTGFPAGTLPVGFRENGVPIGLCFIARPFAENTLFNAMYAAEQLIGRRTAPKMTV